MVRKILVLALAVLIPAGAQAVYNANGGFVVTGVATYVETDSLYITVSSPPTHNACNSSFFVISGTTPDRRKALLARLLLAKATGETVNFGYDATGDCAEGYIRVHRVG